MSTIADQRYQHPRRTLLTVLVFVLVAGFFGGPVAGQLEDSGGFTPDDSGSARASERIEAASGLEEAPGVILLAKLPQGAPSPGAAERIEELEAELGAVPGVARVASVVSTGDRGLVAQDGRSTYLAATLRADADEDLVIERLEERFADTSGVTLGGSTIASTQIGETVTEDLGRAELIAFPVLIVLSLLFFRGRAALLPLVVGVTTVLGTFLAMLLVNQVYALSIFALNLVIGLGLGLAIDYTLFLVTRYREELERSGPGAGAIRTTMATAGRTVLFSAATVSAALVTLTLFPLGFLQSMGIAGAVVALVAAAAALTISPALFAIWGDKLRHRRRPEGEGGGWYRLSHAVMRRPGAIAVATTLVMLALSLPALRAVWTPVDDSVIPTDKSARAVSDALRADFAGQNTTPLTIAIAAPRSREAQVASYADGLDELDGVRAMSEPRPLDASTWQVDVDVDGPADGKVAQALVSEVRDREAPFDVLVGGAAAEFVDQQEAIGARLPGAAALLCVLTFSILWLMTGSVVLPVKAILMNALTVGAALGVLTFIYQDGRLEKALGYTANGGIEPSNFLVAAATVFALSTDYGVFLLGRIKEARDAGHSERESVAIGLERTGRVVTAAAILLAVAIGVFSTSSISFIQQIGIASAFGVLIDAFVVRALLVPSLMALLGKWNWWSPTPLRRLHNRIGLAEAAPVNP